MKKNNWRAVGTILISLLFFLLIIVLHLQVNHIILWNLLIIPMVCVFFFFKSWKGAIAIFIGSTIIKYSIIYIVTSAPGFPEESTINAPIYLRLLTTFSNGFLFFLMIYLILQLKNQNEVLKKAIFIDALTNTNNKRFMELYMEYFKPNTIDTDITLLLIDIDNFQQINTRLGREAGNNIIREVAECIRRNTRNSDLIIREDQEDSFSIFLKETKLDGGLKVAENILSQIRELSFDAIDVTETITVSIGVKEYHHKHDLYEFLHNADIALKKAKANGKNQIMIFEENNEALE